MSVSTAPPGHYVSTVDDLRPAVDTTRHVLLEKQDIAYLGSDGMLYDTQSQSRHQRRRSTCKRVTP
ncbi:MAG: hypothetical protein WD070_08285 [Pirellulaceae bacterium]